MKTLRNHVNSGKSKTIQNARVDSWDEDLYECVKSSFSLLGCSPHPRLFSLCVLFFTLFSSPNISSFFAARGNRQFSFSARATILFPKLCSESGCVFIFSSLMSCSLARLCIRLCVYVFSKRVRIPIFAVFFTFIKFVGSVFPRRIRFSEKSFLLTLSSCSVV